MSKAAVSKDVSRYFEVIPDFAAFMDADGLALEFPLTISQLAKAAQTTVHTVKRNCCCWRWYHCCLRLLKMLGISNQATQWQAITRNKAMKACCGQSWNTQMTTKNLITIRRCFYTIMHLSEKI